MNRRVHSRERVYTIEELDGFYVDESLDRCIHITFDEEDIIVLDIFNTARAAYTPIGEPLSIIELNLKTGVAKLFTNGR